MEERKIRDKKTQNALRNTSRHKVGRVKGYDIPNFKEES